MTSTRPYLLRAFYEWIVDNHMTPYVVIDAESPGTQVPNEFVEDGRIVLNISHNATENLNISNDLIEFNASFSGEVQHIYAPVSAVLAVYARENGRGMVFSDDDDDTDEGSEQGDNGSGDSPDTPPSGGKKPKLTIVK